LGDFLLLIWGDKKKRILWGFMSLWW